MENKNSHPIVNIRDGDTRWQAQAKVRQAFRRGKMPAIEDAVRARGMVIQERENSIFTDAWVPIAVICLIIGFLFDRNLGMIALGSVLLLIVWVSGWWKDNALVGVRYEREFDHTHVFPDEPVAMTVTIENKKWLPLTWLMVKDELPVAPLESSRIARLQSETTGEYTLQNTFAMAGYEEKKRLFTLSFPTRGFKTLGPVRYQSGDIFTLYTIERTHDHRATVVVFPRIWTMAELGLPAKEPFGPINTRKSLFTDPIKTRGIRDYEPGDRFRDVHWKATARRGSLQTKVYDPSTAMTAAIFLNVATMPKHWQGHFPELMERAVSVAGSVASYGAEQKWAVGMFANGSLPGSDQALRVQPGRSPDQLRHILEALAAVTEFATSSIDKLIRKESPRLPWAATLILVTAVLTDEITTELIRLRQAGRRLAVIYLGEEAPVGNLDGIYFYHLGEEMPAFNTTPTVTAFQ